MGYDVTFFKSDNRQHLNRLFFLNSVNFLEYIEKVSKSYSDLKLNGNRASDENICKIMHDRSRQFHFLSPGKPGKDIVFPELVFPHM